jgi:hypothetical protein
MARPWDPLLSNWYAGSRLPSLNQGRQVRSFWQYADQPNPVLCAKGLDVDDKGIGAGFRPSPGDSDGVDSQSVKPVVVAATSQPRFPPQRVLDTGQNHAVRGSLFNH